MDSTLNELLELQRSGRWADVVQLAKGLLDAGYQPADADYVGIVGAVAADAYMHLHQLAKAHEAVNRSRREVLSGTLAEAYTLAQGVAVLSLGGSPEKAISWGREFLDKLPTFPERARRYVLGVCHDMSYALRNMGELDQAINYLHLARAAAEDSASPLAVYFTVVEAEVELDKGNLAAAQSLLDPIDAVTVPDEHLDDYYVVKGRIAEASGDIITASDCAMQALAWCNRGHDGTVWAFLLMSRVLMQRGHLREAQRLCEEAKTWAIRAGREDLFKIAAKHLQS